jgi:hypothetical protein
MQQLIILQSQRLKDKLLSLLQLVYQQFFDIKYFTIKFGSGKNYIHGELGLYAVQHWKMVN